MKGELERHASLKVRGTDMGEFVALTEKGGGILVKLRWIWARALIFGVEGGRCCVRETHVMLRSCTTTWLAYVVRFAYTLIITQAHSI